jgi:hypothetical protein
MNINTERINFNGLLLTIGNIVYKAIKEESVPVLN